MKACAQIWTTLSLFIMLLAIVDTKLQCPEKTFQIGENQCFFVENCSKHDEREKQMMNDQNYALSECDNIDLGGLKWHLPTMDTYEKMDKILGDLTDRANDQDKHYYIWIGMRRRGSVKENERVADESKWYWTRSNATVENHRYSRYLWADNEPSRGHSNESRDCAVAVADFKKKEMKFVSVPCNDWESQSRFAIRPTSYMGLACDAELSQKKATSFFEKWYFILICVLLVLGPFLIAMTIFACMNRRRLKRRKAQSGESSSSRHGRFRLPKWSRADRKDESKLKSRKRSESFTYASFGGETSGDQWMQGSNTAASLSGSSSDLRSLSMPQKGKSKELSIITKDAAIKKPPSKSVPADPKNIIPSSVIKPSKTVAKSTITPTATPATKMVKGKKQDVKVKKEQSKKVTPSKNQASSKKKRLESLSKKNPRK